MAGFNRPEFFLADQAQVRQARLLLGIDRDLRTLLPQALGIASHAVALQNGVLRIYCENGAAAAKLRQLAPRLVSGLKKRGHAVEALKVRVTPGPPPARATPVKTLTLGTGARAALAELHAALAAGGLKSAVGKLLARAPLPQPDPSSVGELGASSRDPSGDATAKIEVAEGRPSTAAPPAPESTPPRKPAR